jgi:hypothetical protein
MPVHDAKLTFDVRGPEARDAARHLSPRHVSLVTLVAAGIAVSGVVTSVRQNPPPSSVIVARHLVVFEDDSGSMSRVAGTIARTEEWMQAELEPLKAYGVTETIVTVDGFGVMQNGSNNFLNALERSVTADTDAVYLFSDFWITPDSFDLSDDDGFAALRTFARDHHLRVYLRTVRSQPAPQLLAIAHDSGGGFIGEP